jgi:hypothetical protein
MYNNETRVKYCAICKYKLVTRTYNGFPKISSDKNKFTYCICGSCINMRKNTYTEDASKINPEIYAAIIYDRLGICICCEACLDVYIMAPVGQENGKS